MDASLPDLEWFASSERIYGQTWRSHVGSPETFAQAGREHFSAQNFGVAMLFFRKAIDLMHTQYTFNEMSVREVTHRLRTISSACGRPGVPCDLYLTALQEIGAASPNVNVDDILR